MRRTSDVDDAFARTNDFVDNFIPAGVEAVSGKGSNGDGLGSVELSDELLQRAPPQAGAAQSEHQQQLDSDVADRVRGNLQYSSRRAPGSGSADNKRVSVVNVVESNVSSSFDIPASMRDLLRGGGDADALAVVAPPNRRHTNVPERLGGPSLFASSNDVAQIDKTTSAESRPYETYHSPLSEQPLTSVLMPPRSGSAPGNSATSSSRSSSGRIGDNVSVVSSSEASSPLIQGGLPRPPAMGPLQLMYETAAISLTARRRPVVRTSGDQGRSGQLYRATLSTTETGAATLGQFYGAYPGTIEEQVAAEQEQEKPPFTSKELPLQGALRNVSLRNPYCLHGVILLVPFIFFIVAFAVFLPSISNFNDSKVKVDMSFHLGELTSMLLLEQISASTLNALVATQDSYAGNLKDFFVTQSIVQDEYSLAQSNTDTAIAKINRIISEHVDEITEAMNDISPWQFISLDALSSTRVFALVSSNNAEVMTRYEALTNQVLLFKGFLSLQSAMRTNLDVIEIRTLFSIEMLSVTNAVVLYMKLKESQSSSPGLLALPKEASEIEFIYKCLAMMRVSEVTLRYPSDTRDGSSLDVSPGTDPLALTYINQESPLLEVRLPPETQKALLEMIELTYLPKPYEGYDPYAVYRLWQQMIFMYEATAEEDAGLRKTLDHVFTANDVVRVVCLIALFTLSAIGLVFHAGNVTYYFMCVKLHRRTNLYTRQLRFSLARMHRTALRMLRFNVDEMGREEALASGSAAAARTATSEEHELAIAAHVLRRLEPYMPLPFVSPPLAAPANSLVHGKLFLRPTLLCQRSLVAIRVFFTCPAHAMEGEPETGDDEFHMAASIASSRGNDSILTLGVTPSENSSASEPGSPRTPISTSPRRSGATASKDTPKQSTVQARYHSYMVTILRLMCEHAMAAMPNSKSGSYLELVGENAILWLNLCEDVPYANLVAFAICAAVQEHCEGAKVDVPSMAVCCGDGVVGTVASYAPPGSFTDTPLGEYRRMWSASSFFAERATQQGTAGTAASVGLAMPNSSRAAPHELQHMDGVDFENAKNAKEMLVEVDDRDLADSTPRKVQTDSEESEGDKFVNFMAELPKVQRAFFWMKLLMGMNPLANRAAKKEVVVGETNLTSALLTPEGKDGMGSQLDSLADALGENAVKDDTVVELAEILDSKYTPPQESACLTSFVVYGPITEELEVLLCMGRVHQQPIMANHNAAYLLLEERRAYLNSLRGRYNAADHDPHGSDVMHSKTTRRRRTSVNHFAESLKSDQGTSESKMTLSPSAVAASGVSWTSGTTAKAQRLSSANEGDISSKFQVATEDAMVTREEAEYRMRHLVPVCLPVDILEASRAYKPIHSNAGRNEKKKKEKNQTEEERAAEAAATQVQPLQNPEYMDLASGPTANAEALQTVPIYAGEEEEEERGQQTSTLEFKDYRRKVEVRDAVVSPLTGMQCDLQCVLKPVYTLMFKLPAHDDVDKEGEGKMLIDLINIQPPEYAHPQFGTKNVEGSLEMPNNDVRALAADEWLGVFHHYSQLCYCVSELQIVSNTSVSKFNKERVRSLAETLQAAISNYRSNHVLTSLGMQTCNRMLDIASLMVSCIERGPLPERFNGFSPLSARALGSFYLYHATIMH